MQKTFIACCLKDIIKTHLDLSESIFILPSKRACTFLKNELAHFTNSTFFLPDLYSIEEFIELVSGLKAINNTETLFHFYNIYKKQTPNELQENFEVFCKWGQVLLHDFNEIDRYKIDANLFFNNLASIKQIERWSPNQTETTSLITNYLKFWDKSYVYYKCLKEHLLKIGKVYQGLQYKEATEQIEMYLQNTTKHHFFIGFNALNSCEEVIFNETVLQNKGTIYWDIDEQFLNNNSSGLFIKKYRREWPIYPKHPFLIKSNNFLDKKSIHVHALAKNIGQLKKVGQLLSGLSDEELTNTAVVLSEENLLEPLLNSIPNNVKHINITMGLPLKSTPLASFIDLIFQIYKSKKSNGFYYKTVINFLSNSYAKLLFSRNQINNILKLINTNNILYVSKGSICQELNSEIGLQLFNLEDFTVNGILKTFKHVVYSLKKVLDIDKNNKLLDLEYLVRFNQLFNLLANYQSDFNIINDVNSLYNLYKELLVSVNLDLQGEPIRGLQIMGMLESRALDFKRVILVSVNEGILPSGKSNNSFIPFDLKVAYELPTYLQKDAVYSYHFFRLLQRAEDIHILYNTEPEGLNSGEKSRFILQLEKLLQPNHIYVSETSVPKVIVEKNNLLTINKNDSVIKRLDEIAVKGFSPSALTQYIRNPIDFYTQKILGLYEDDSLEETVANNTLGTIVHNTLENFYKPYLNIVLNEDIINKMIAKIDDEVASQFKTQFKQGNISLGKNYLIFNVAKRYVYNFLQFELKEIKRYDSIIVREVETEFNNSVFIPELNKTIKLTGKVDRIDEVDGKTRIIDYKTGKVTQTELSVKDWDEIIIDYKKYSKAFQVLTYAYMMWADKPTLPANTEAGIISFKNIKSGFMPFKENKNSSISPEVMEKFEIQLRKMIVELYNTAIPFTEKEII